MNSKELQHLIYDVKHSFIPHVSAQTIDAALDRILRDGSSGLSPTALVIGGAPGVGKTAAVFRWMGDYPITRQKPSDIRPVAYAKLIGGRITFKTVAQALLAGFEDSLTSPHRTAFDLIKILVRRAKEQSTQLILLDEAHLVFNAQRQQFQYDIGEWIKTLLNELPCPVGFVGSETMIPEFRHNLSLFRRIDEIIEVKPYDWRIKKFREEFRQILEVYTQIVSPFLQCDFAEMALAHQIWTAAEGKIGLVSRLIARAIAEANDANSKSVNTKQFWNVFNGLCVNDEQRQRNPFGQRARDDTSYGSFPVPLRRKPDLPPEITP